MAETTNVSRFIDVVFKEEDGYTLDRLRIKGPLVVSISGLSLLADDPNNATYIQECLSHADPNKHVFSTKRDGTLIVRER